MIMTRSMEDKTCPNYQSDECQYGISIYPAILIWYTYLFDKALIEIITPVHVNDYRLQKYNMAEIQWQYN